MHKKMNDVSDDKEDDVAKSYLVSSFNAEFDSSKI
jgi:hypothetical protein